MTDLPVLSPHELTSRLERARLAEPDGLVALDADGTLWSGDVGVDTFEAALVRGALHAAALPRLHAEADAFGLARADDASAQARILYAAVTAGRVPEEHGFALMAWAFAGFSVPALDAFVASVLDETALDARLQGELAPVLAWASEHGVPCWVVSASPRAVIAAAVARLAIPATRVVAMTPVLEGGVVQPRLVEPLPYGPGKVHALREAAGDVPILAAFGDSAFDAPMLARAAVPVAVRPKSGLLRLEIPRVATLAPAPFPPHFAASLQQRKPAS